MAPFIDVIFSAGFANVIFLFPGPALAQRTVHKDRTSDRIRQRIGRIGKAQQPGFAYFGSVGEVLKRSFLPG